MTRRGPASLEPGGEFAGCEIERVIGQGGMGIVYLGRDITLNRPVAIKVLLAGWADTPEFSNRFLREQRVAAAIDHPNIVPIYSAGEEAGSLYLTMRYVDGPNLGSVVADGGPLEPARVGALVSQIAAGLDAAHMRGLIHRDVKPENILVASSGAREHAYITDFGIAKSYGYSDAASTGTGIAVGTPAYMAPEQAMGNDVSPASDVYALGALAFFLLTGRPPFLDESPMRVLLAHLQDPPPAPSQFADLPALVDDAISTALEKDSQRRPPSAGEFARALESAVEGVLWRPVQPAPAPPPVTEAPFPVAPPAQAAHPPSAAAPDPYPPPAPTAVPETLPPFRPADAMAPGPAPPPSTGFITYVEPPSGPIAARIPLNDRFRYVHQPLVDDEELIPMLGNEEAVAALVDRIAHSGGGSFLITGFRGVGKTTIIARALRRLRREGEDITIVPVTLNVGRPKTVEVLLFEVIRRVFEALKDEGLFERMSAHVQRELILAYWRTSMSFSETHSKAVERGAGLKLGVPAGLLEALGPKLELSRKATNSLATQASFLAYTEADVEHDFLRILSLLDRGDPHAANGRRRRRRPEPPPWRGKLVVVIDELDKLTEQEDGMRCIEDLLSGLKNLLTAQGVHFLFVAGPDLHDVALRASHRGNSVYESVFAWQLYVPCLWHATDHLLDAVVAPHARANAQLGSFAHYLTFKSRGVPRLLVMELNSFVRFTGDRPEIVIEGTDLARVEFYAALDRTLAAFVHQQSEGLPRTIHLDDDRWRLGAYYLTDWILRSDGSFTADDLVRSEARANLDPLLSLSARKVTDLLEHLARHEIVERVRGRSSDHTFYGDAPDAQATVYRLHGEVERKLSAFARVNERERAELAGGAHAPVASAQPWADTDVGGMIGGGRFELLEELDRGGLGRVYRARTQFRHEEVAIKLYDLANFPGDDVMRSRVRRKAKIALAAEHPGIVRTHEIFEDDDGATLGVVMDLLSGTPLAQVLSMVRLSPEEAVALVRPLADALAYVSSLGVARLDLKPSSVIVTGGQRPVILDLGLAKIVRDSAIDIRGTATMAAPVVLGTPAYAAPEQLRGQAADIRADIYSLGLILYEMVAHRQAREGDLATILRTAVSERVDVSRLNCSPALRDCAGRMVELEPDERFATPEELIAALVETPEAAAQV